VEENLVAFDAEGMRSLESGVDKPQAGSQMEVQEKTLGSVLEEVLVLGSAYGRHLTAGGAVSGCPRSA
jgi:hypothetical protein